MLSAFKRLLLQSFSMSRTSRLSTARIGKFDMLLNKDHALPFYLKSPFYSTNLPRLAAAVKKKISWSHVD
jgi:hypothetical protein